MKTYTSPEINITVINTTDIITVSAMALKDTQSTFSSYKASEINF